MSFLNNSTQNKESGFSLIECVIAIAILATVVGSMISMQGTIARILQFSTDKEKAGIELRSIMAQFEYLTNTKSTKALPAVGQSIEWPSKFDPMFTDKVSSIKSDIKISQFLISTIQIYYLGKDDAPDIESFKPIANLIDTQISLLLVEPAFNSVASVNWVFGKEKKSLSEKIFLINNNAIESLNPPNIPVP